MTMTAHKLSPELSARARDIEALMLKQLLSVGQKNIAQSIGLSESTISRWKEGEIERWCKVIALLDLKLVPFSAQCHPARYIQALKTLAELGLQAEGKRPGPIGWD